MNLKVEGYETVFVPDLETLLAVSERAKRIAISPAFKELDAKLQEMRFVWWGFKLLEEAGNLVADLKTIEEMLKRYPESEREYWSQEVAKIKPL